MEAYEQLSRIGEGTYGVVMRCRHLASRELVAIKRFKETDSNEQVRKTSLREARVLAALDHDHVVALRARFSLGGRLHLVLEHVDRCLLDDLEAAPGGLSPGSTRRLLWQLTSALAYLHSRAVVHRDVKPENVLVSAAGLVKLCDFGFARVVPGAGRRGGAGGGAGGAGASPPLSDYVATRWYRAPELLVGDRGYGPPVDVWALGCMAAEVATGRPLFPGECDADQLARVVRCVGGLTRAHRAAAAANPHLASSGGEKGAAAVAAAAATRGGGRPDASLDARYAGVLPPALLAFVRACLHPDPAKRASAADLMAHPYFDGVGATFPPAWHAERAASASARARPLGPVTDAADPADDGLLAPPTKSWSSGSIPLLAKAGSAVGPAPPKRGRGGLAAGRGVVAVGAAAVGPATERAPPPPPASAESPPRRAAVSVGATAAAGWGARQAALAADLGGASVKGFGVSPTPPRGARADDDDDGDGLADDDDDGMAVDGSPDTPARPVGCVVGLTSPWRALARR